MTNFSPVKCEMDGLSPAAGTDGNPLAQPFWQSSRSSLPTFDVHGRGTARGRLQNPAHIDSIHRSEGSRVGQDTCRYMQAAAASSQKAVHQLLSRLQTYRSFKPFLSPPAPYRDNFFTHDRGFSSFSGPSHGRLSTATVSRDQLWQMVDGILDTSVAQLLQHNAEGHFIMTLQSALGLEAPISTAKSGTVIESRKAATPAINGGATELASEERTPAGGPRQPLPPALQKTAVMSSFAPASALANRWALDHPSATTAAVEEQHHAWATFDQQRQRTSRCFYLQAMQEQLDVLQAEQARDAADTTHSPPNRGDDSHSYLLDVHSSSDSEDAVTKAEEEKQQALWRTFQDGPVLTVGASESPRETALGVPGIVSDYLESTDLQDWLHCSWAHRTHRHESAALRIQCAYRVYRARCKVREMRYERRQAFLASLSAERKARQVWDLALQVQKDTTTTTTSGTDSTLRALQFFINKVNAVVAKHRARKQYQQKQDAEIRRYAATRIQAVYRGHRTRVFVTELRHPEIVALRKQLQQENCAKLIQTCWRRYAAQRHWRLARHAACVLQSMYRCHAARRMLAERRYQRNLEASAELTKFAVQRIERWYGSVLAARNAIGRAHVAELLVLQRVCRGYQGRHGVQEEKRLSRLRSAVRTIEQRRWRVMEAREAIERRAALSTANAAKRIASMRDDAAVTIQRAWRRSFCSSATSMTQTALTEDELDDALGLAIRAANTAAFIINSAIDDRTNNIEAQIRNNPNDLVTQYEKQCKEEVLNILRVGTPSYAILSDAVHSEAVLDDGPTWIVGPIDGTVSFEHGLFDFCVSIALALRKEPILGVVCAPRLQEVFTAVKNRGAFSNGQRIHVSLVDSLKQSVVLLHESCTRSDAAVRSVTAMQAELAKHPVQGLRCNGSAALDMCLVAAGRAELFWEAGVNPWNVAAGVIIVREAGGVVHDVESTDAFDFTRRGVCCGCSLDVTKHGVELSLKHNYRSSVLNTSS